MIHHELGDPNVRACNFAWEFVGLILVELDEIGLQILQLLDYFRFLSLWALIFPFFIYCLLFSVQNVHDSKRGTSSFKYRHIDGRTPSFDNLNMNLGWRLYNLSCQYLNSCCKYDSNYGNMMFSIYSCGRLFYLFI